MRLVSDNEGDLMLIQLAELLRLIAGNRCRCFRIYLTELIRG